MRTFEFWEESSSWPDSAARCNRKQRSQSGDVNRCTIVIEQRSSNLGEMVGSCVEMKTRVPRWRCKRIEERRVLVKVEASAPAFIYYRVRPVRYCSPRGWEIQS
jgi:hypothetical protein